MRHTVVRSSELEAAGTWSVDDVIGGDSKLGCYLCGLSPRNIEKAGRVNPRVALLEPAGPTPGDTQPIPLPEPIRVLIAPERRFAAHLKGE